jgi:hypothetical protein
MTRLLLLAALCACTKAPDPAAAPAANWPPPAAATEALPAAVSPTADPSPATLT